MLYWDRFRPTLDWRTLDKGIARHSLGAVAHGDVVDDLADGIAATGSGTGISALLPDAGQVPGALRAEDTLWPAGHVGISLILGQTLALSLVEANGIAAAGTGIAGISGFFLDHRWGCMEGS